MKDKTTAKFFEEMDMRDPSSRLKSRYFGIMMKITASIHYWRKKAGLTQAGLAKEMGTTQSTIARWETSGYDGYTLKKLSEFADKLNLELEIKFTPRNTGTQSSTLSSNEFVTMADNYIKYINRTDLVTVQGEV